MMPRASSIGELLSICSPRARALAESARERIAAVVPGATEKLRAGWGLIGYNAPAYFAYIVPAEDHLKIGFEWGVALPDPAGLLEGDGKQVRYAAIRTAEDLRSPALAELLTAAASLPPPRKRK